ncbi:HIT family protein [Aestuariimicrobium ganziense]|uniref:HIT family protein n=1 Tax=Aestuariimicrobium ganziense TaxID=2773677 RepID=UPI001944BE08|nr:HIT domain-containing protein [Aestuariimicrobium ganziense]
MSEQQACVFCRIVAGELPASVVHSDEHAVAILDLSPEEPGHTLVLSRRHVADLVDDPMALAEVAPTVSSVAAVLLERLGATGINAVVNCGESAGQTVDHLHVHLLPREVADLDKDDAAAVLARITG